MGMFSVKVKLASLSAPQRTEEVSLLVDTGATLSWIPRDVLERLGAPAFSTLPFTLADGRHLERDTTAVLILIDGRKAAVQVAFGEAGEAQVLGATALEGLGFMVDPVGKRLVPRDLLALLLKKTELRDVVLDWIRRMPRGECFIYQNALKYLQNNFQHECTQRSELQQGVPAWQRDAGFAIWDARLRHKLVRLTGVRGQRQRT